MKMLVLVEKSRLSGRLSIKTAVSVEMSEQFLLADSGDEFLEIERLKVGDITEIAASEFCKGRGEHG